MQANARADMLTRLLALQPHPEGGSYREIFRSACDVSPADGRGARQALTAIYFLLVAGQHSRWHRVRSDETWTHLEGDALELLCLDPAAGRVHRAVLGPAGTEAAPLQAVPAGTWQAARPLGAYTLAACHVGPGFAFDDFTMAANDAAAAQAIHAQGEEYGRWL